MGRDLKKSEFTVICGFKFSYISELKWHTIKIQSFRNLGTYRCRRGNPPLNGGEFQNKLCQNKTRIKQKPTLSSRMPHC